MTNTPTEVSPTIDPVGAPDGAKPAQQVGDVVGSVRDERGAVGGMAWPYGMRAQDAWAYIYGRLEGLDRADVYAYPDCAAVAIDEVKRLAAHFMEKSR